MALDALRFWWRRSRQVQYRWLWLLASVGVYFLVLNLPMVEAPEAARKALAVFGMAVFLWGTNSLPLPVTGILILFMLPASGAMEAKDAYANFGTKAVFFVLGVFILASPIMRSGLSKRLALAWLSRFGRTQNTLAGSILAISTILASFISAHAVAAMLLPVILELVRASGAKPASRFAQKMFFALAWGAIIGANGTLLGGARAPLAMGILQSTTGQTIGFAYWAALCIPIVIIMAGVAYMMILAIGKDDRASLEQAREFLTKSAQSLGRISRREIYTAAILLFTITLWVTKADLWGLEIVAFIGVLLAFVFRVAFWREVETDVNWGIILMYGSAIALSTAITKTGGSEYLANHVFPKWIESPLLVFGLIAALSILLTEFMSNAAAVAMMTPVAIPIAQQHGIDPRVIVLGIVVPAGLAFMFAVSTPAIAMILGTGYVRASQVLRWGFLLNLASYMIFLLMAHFYWPLIGLPW
jgi:sodium-dependent dicarboxylate transporter 2/3/5